MITTEMLVQTQTDATSKATLNPQPVVASLLGRGSNDTLVIEIPAQPAPIACLARTTVSIADTDFGKEVLVVFEAGDVQKPIVIGILAGQPLRQQTVSLKTDQGRLQIRADREIVLSCGAASLTLSRDGRVLLRGTNVLSRSSGLHRVQGASVRIN